MPFGWIENNLLLFGIVSMLTGIVLGILGGAIQRRRRNPAFQSRRSLRPNAIGEASRMPAAKPPVPEHAPGDRSAPRVQLPRGTTVHRMRAGGEPIARIGPARRTRTPGRRS
ncbi:MAG TPA: hypothetical protein VKH83_14000 [Methylomirabilota bacterium]|nr:hypothetical protein [Methylomirabilota bacterium]